MKTKKLLLRIFTDDDFYFVAHPHQALRQRHHQYHPRRVCPHRPGKEE